MKYEGEIEDIIEYPIEFEDAYRELQNVYGFKDEIFQKKSLYQSQFLMNSRTF